MKVEFRLASQNCPIESRILFLSAGKIWQVRADGGRWGHFLCDASNCENIQPAGANAINSTIPNGEKIRSTHTATLKWPHLPPSAHTCYISPALKNKILLSIGQFCDASLNSASQNCTHISTTEVQIFSKEKGSQETECGTSTVLMMSSFLTSS